MEEGQYVCSAKDCNMRFASEDTFQLHKKRHEMVLSLNKNTLPASDQTPTPVRFMRQCEEIGLFQDLQKVNPFEETFRKAAEAVKKGFIPKQQNISILNHTTSEDLHTPHIFPDEIITIDHKDEDAKNEREKIEDIEVVVRSEADTSLKAGGAIHESPPVSNDRVSTTVGTIEPVTVSRGCIIGSGSSDESVVRVTTAPTYTTLLPDQPFADSSDPVQVLLRMPNGSLVQLATKPVTNSIIPVNITPSIQIEETVKVLPRSCTNGGTVILATHGLQKSSEPSSSSSSNRLSTKDVKQKLKQLLGNTSKIIKQPNNGQRSVSVVPKSDIPIMRKYHKNDSDGNLDESEKEKRKKILERNRKAAIRCRERRKRWVEELRKKADAMAVTNRALNDEIRCLKAEVANLRTLLLAHSNCPVTLAQSSQEIVTNEESNEVVTKRPRRECLTLDIEQASRATVTTIELDTPTPTIVRSDKILSSVALPATPEQDRLVTFTDILAQERPSEMNEEMVEDRHLTSSSSITGGTTTVIQINPNAIRPTHGFS